MAKYTKSILIFLVIFSLVFMGAACQSGKKEEGAGTFLGGTDGILVSFQKNAPIDSFGKDEEIPIKVLLENKGEFDLKAGEAKAKLYGINYKSFGLEKAENYKGTEGILKGKSEFTPDGNSQEIDFGKLKYNLDVSGEFVLYTLRAKVCYPYQTKALVSVCMMSRNLQETSANVCTVEGEKVKSKDISSSPLQITSLTEELMGGNDVKFTLKIENKGLGSIYSEGSDCTKLESPTEKLAKENLVTVEFVNPVDMKCGQDEKNKVVINLKNNIGTLICKKSVTNAYPENLDFRLKFVYISETSKNIKIEKR